jgi:hypothetical protein
MGNSGRAEYVEALEELASSDDSVIAEHARWAIDRLRREDSQLTSSEAEQLRS